VLIDVFDFWRTARSNFRVVIAGAVIAIIDADCTDSKPDVTIMPQAHHHPTCRQEADEHCNNEA
tara:strand:+ start:62070 stop:62261 length:192 start_codon:yes stop_codon:yes gene_type:complete